MEDTFNWIDWSIVGLIIISGIISLWRGFIRESFSAMIWLLAILTAWLFLDDFAAVFEGWISSYTIRITFAGIMLIIMVLLTGALINTLAGKLITFSGLSASDRLLGIFFGLLRGIIIVTILTGITNYLSVKDTRWWQNSVLMPKFEQLAVWSKEIVKDKVYPLVYNKKMQ